MLLWLAFLALPFLPLRFSARIQHAGQTQGVLGIQVGIIRFRFPFRIARTARGGHQLTFLPRRPREKPRPASSAQMRRGMTALGTFLRADKARRFLLRHTDLAEFTALLRPGLEDAAANALLSGTLRGIVSFIPPALRSRVCIRVQPDFFTGRSTGHLRCIVSVRLGILLITGGMVLLAWLRERREHPPVSKEA